MCVFAWSPSAGQGSERHGQTKAGASRQTIGTVDPAMGDRLPPQGERQNGIGAVTFYSNVVGTARSHEAVNATTTVLRSESATFRIVASRWRSSKAMHFRHAHFEHEISRSCARSDRQWSPMHGVVVRHRPVWIARHKPCDNGSSQKRLCSQIVSQRWQFGVPIDPRTLRPNWHLHALSQALRGHALATATPNGVIRYVTTMKFQPDCG